MAFFCFKLMSLFLGSTQIGLLRNCIRVGGRSGNNCYWPSLSCVSVIVFVCAVSTIFCLFGACGFLLLSHWRHSNARNGVVLGFIARKDNSTVVF